MPKKISAAANLVIVTIGGATYTLAKEFAFESKTQHKLTVTANKSTSGLSLSVENWLIDENEYSGEAK